MKGLYIHIPFCVQKCKYCDFVSFPDSESYHDKYIEALICEAENYSGSEFDSVFIGGGTPTVLGEHLLERLLAAINEKFRLSADCEFSVEANPKTLTAEKLGILQNGGVNRLSIGVQSFNDDELRRLGRIHSAKDAYNTVYMAKEYGFDNINIDLMSALPEQTGEKLMYSLKTAVELEPAHISCYSLILEDGTPFAAEYDSGKLIVPDEDTDRMMYRDTCEYLKRCGYNRYEISNFAKPEYECRHNIKYWSCDEYIGLGIAAHSYSDKTRFYNTCDLRDYINGNYRGGENALSEKDMIEEFMIMGLRMTCGVSEREFFARFAKHMRDVYGAVTDKHIKGGFIRCADGRYFLTEKGIDVSNSVLCDFIM